MIWLLVGMLESQTRYAKGVIAAKGDNVKSPHRADLNNTAGDAAHGHKLADGRGI